MRSTAATKLWRVSHGPSDLRLRWRRAFRAAFLLCAPFILLYTAFRLFGVRINLTSSLERGFYIVSRTPSANLVEFCPEGEAASISLQRGYRAPGGTCPDGGSPLMKPIAAVAGDHVEVTAHGIQVYATLIRYRARRPTPQRGPKLAPSP